MRTILSILTLLLAATVLRGAVYDDFSSRKGWNIGKGLSGKFSYGRESGMTLENHSGGPGWITVTRGFEVDLDRDPEFTVKVKSAGGACEVKLINLATREKQSVLKFRQGGVYRVNLTEKYGWKGRAKINVALYVLSRNQQAQFEFVRFAPPGEKEPPQLAIAPLFHSAGYSWQSGDDTPIRVSFRKEGGEWKRAYPPVFFDSDRGFRGSLVRLEENSTYELKITEEKSDRTLAQKKFRTWNSEVPVARTIELGPENFRGKLRITERGTPAGWIRYTARKGFVLTNDNRSALLELDGAACILLDGLTLKGGERSAVDIRNCEHIRVINCDISGWGRLGKQRFDKDGKFYDPKGKAINYDGGIYLTRSFGTVIERCYIHDPRNTANAWFYSHPAGPEGIMISSPTSTVIRYNDIVGSDPHRWNDAIEGTGNFHADGGFNRDADIYGNYLAFTNDDGIELDGGQQNVRCFLNRIEGWYCGISIQGCMESPSYLFRNLIMRGGDRFGSAGQPIKTSSSRSGKNATSFLFNNTIHGPGGQISMLPHLRVIAFNNLLSGSGNFARLERSPQSRLDYNLLPKPVENSGRHTITGEPGMTDPAAGIFTLRPDSPARGAGRVLDNFQPEGPVDLGAFQSREPLSLPFRPIPVESDRGVLDFGELRPDSPRVMRFGVSNNGEERTFRIRRSDTLDWVEVSPEEGVLRRGETKEFQVKLLTDRMNSRRIYRGAFLVRFADGFSRPVSVYAENPTIHVPFRPAPDAVYIDAARPTGGTRYKVISDPQAENGDAIRLEGARGENYAVYEFELKEDGNYFLLFRLRGEAPANAHDSLFCGLDDEKPAETHLNGNTCWTWSVGAPGKGQFQRLRVYPLKKGKHTLRIAPREPLDLDSIALAKDPGVFEPDR